MTTREALREAAEASLDSQGAVERASNHSPSYIRGFYDGAAFAEKGWSEERAVALERLGPAGYKILEECAKLRVENERLRAMLNPLCGCAGDSRGIIVVCHNCKLKNEYQSALRAHDGGGG